MSGSNHEHSSGHGHDSNDGSTDIIPVGSLQDKILLAICVLTLAGLVSWAQGFWAISNAHQGENGRETHTIQLPGTP